ncbi:MAG TPA: hypothetical protein VN721_15335 [Flavipsychrobacter sp.]|nr:hypothetical protein [Flavipsychrobacter sp.]
MKPILITLLLTLLIIASSWNNDSCKNIRNGSFESAFVKRKGYKGVMVRHDSIQLETINGKLGWDTCIYQVKWHPNCEYTLKVIYSNFLDESPFKLGDSINIYIDKIINDNEIIYHSIFKRYPVVHDTMWKLDDSHVNIH